MAEEEEKTEDGEVHSTLPALTPPEFKSAVPDFITSKLTPQEQYMVSTMSILEQRSAWQLQEAVATRRFSMQIDVRQTKTERRLNKIEKWRDKFTAKTAIFGGGGLVVFTALITKLIEVLWK